MQHLRNPESLSIFNISILKTKTPTKYERDSGRQCFTLLFSILKTGLSKAAFFHPGFTWFSWYPGRQSPVDDEGEALRPIYNDQTAEVTPNGGLVRESLQNPIKSG